MLSVQSGGKPILRARAEAGSLLGLPSVFSENPYSMSAVACSEAQIEQLSLDSLRELTQSRPDLLINVVKILANEVRAVRIAVIEVFEQNRRFFPIEAVSELRNGHPAVWIEHGPEGCAEPLKDPMIASPLA
jgi:CRP-like cAMP-binding protein